MAKVWVLIALVYRTSCTLFDLVRFYFTRRFARLAAYLAIRWRNGDGSKGSEIDAGNKVPPRNSPEEAEEGRQHAGSLRQPACSGGDEEEEDDEVYRADTTDELYCGYDSTWETEEPRRIPDKKTTGSAVATCSKFRRFQNAARDMYNYRHNYPTKMSYWNQDRLSDDKPNLEFYLGKKPCLPDGMYIHDFHNNWHGQYDTLEYVHTYIQWLFPLQEPGMNSQATTLTKEEIQDFLEKDTAKENLLKSYKLMLDFYGIKLCDEETGKVQRASNWRERFNNLNSHTHNNLRITRILKCIGTLGYPHYQYPLVHFFLNETLVNGELPYVKDSVLNYFVFAVLNKKERRRLIKFAYSKYVPKEEFVWCPKKIQMMWSGPQTGINVENEDRARCETSKTV